ncbi:hypothetical protein [Nocardioides allogilvus]|uniref:hypothetical protein n=1 Tax=Nocardioides allogilvus TaxID=2072017 RepID=UPI001300BA1B|nr:hypothetical protein [Nocardioides allogilvus]
MTTALTHTSGPVVPGTLRAGDRVRLRPLADILATLDETGSFEGVPFMREMTAYAGRTMTVYRRLEKICDYLGEESRSRRMNDAVLLKETRCDGSGHGGCQAECRIFWKEVWLERATGPDPVPEELRAVPGALLPLLEVGSHRTDPDLGEVFRCQATEATRATTPLPEKAIGQYVREVRVGNIGVPELVRVGSSALVTKLARKAGLRPYLPLEVAGDQRVDGEKLGLQPGEWVRVRTKEEIGRTLNAGAAHRGLMFTHEMAQYCGQSFRVRSRVERLLNETTGEMLHMKQECIALEDVICKGHFTSGAWFCAREHLPLWREDWLERAEAPAGTVCPGSPL